MIPQEIRENIITQAATLVETKTFPPEVLSQLESAIRQDLAAMYERIARLEHALNQIRDAISNRESASINLFHNDT